MRPGVFWPNTVRKSACFSRPLRFTAAGVAGACADVRSDPFETVAAATPAAATVDRNSLRRMRRIILAAHAFDVSRSTFVVQPSRAQDIWHRVVPFVAGELEDRFPIVHH